MLVRLIAAELDHAARSTVLAERPELRRLVAARVLALPPEAREVVEAASVLGERIVAPIARADDRTHRRRRRARPRPSRGRAARAAFEHALVRDAVYAELSEPRRIALHRAAAEALGGERTRSARHDRRALAACGRTPPLPGVGDARRRCRPRRARLRRRGALRRARGVAARAEIDDAIAQTLVRLAQAQLLQGFAETQRADVRRSCRRGRAQSAAPTSPPTQRWSCTAVDYRACIDRSRRCARTRSTTSTHDDHARRARLLAQLAIDGGGTRRRSGAGGRSRDAGDGRGGALRRRRRTVRGDRRAAPHDHGSRDGRRTVRA